jgi:hypothetical protein
VSVLLAHDVTRSAPAAEKAAQYSGSDL